MADQLETSFDQLAAERDALRRFIADASHELRTPITALKNFNELLRGPALDDPQAQQEFLAESKLQIDRLTWITDNLLDLSRLDAGIAALDFAMHDINEIIQAVLPSFRNRFVEKGIHITLKLDESLPGLKCDRARLESAVSNLVDNAVKFSDQGGEIEIGSQGSQDSIQVWVKDHGPGIPEEIQPYIFERFYRGPDNDQAGSGLGLSIVQSTVNAHRGSIKVESRAGEGSCFTITLPAAEGG
jgi:two-component system phosphate regulon sensor histidine kinase PhoR